MLLRSGIIHLHPKANAKMQSLAIKLMGSFHHTPLSWIEHLNRHNAH